MSDVTPDRTIGGLPQRSKAPDLSSMLARNRTNQPVAPAGADEEPVKTPEVTKTVPRPAKKVAVKKPKTRQASANSDGGKTQVTAYMSTDVRNRARAAYKLTAHLEGDRNWSAFIEAAVLAEVERREQAHNDGDQYEGSQEPLSPGRPLN